jgi:hypothetical protein
MAERKINIDNLESEYPISLGTNSIKKIKQYFNETNNTNFKTIAQIAKHMKTNNLQAQYTIAREFNNFIERKQNSKKDFLRIVPQKAQQFFKSMKTSIENKMGFNDFSFKFYENPIEFAYNKLDSKFKGDVRQQFNKGNDFELTTGTYDKIEKMIYTKLLTHKKSFNRITIIGDDKTISTKTWESFSFDNFKKFLDKMLGYEGANLFNLEFTIHTRDLPIGSGLVRQNTELPSFLIKQGISAITVKENCAFFCFALADCKTPDEKKNMKRPNRFKKWEAKALEIKKEMGIESVSMSFAQSDIFANLRKRQVVILSDNFFEIYKTETFYGDDIVYLYYDKEAEHYHYIDDINSATNDLKRNKKWCKCCNKSYLRINFSLHKCKETVCGLCKIDFQTVENKCQHFRVKKWDDWMQCDVCNVFCPNECCLENHSKICKGTVLKCIDCKKWIKKEHFEDHQCGEQFCKACEKFHKDDNHRCCIPIQTLSEVKDMKIFAYDFESQFIENNTHSVNYAYAEKLFGEEKHEVKSIEEFVKFALEQTNTTFVAHNGKAYDTWLVHKYIIKHTTKRPTNIILAGNKIMYMKIKSIRFVDSLNHIAQPLASFPETFGLKEMKKGFFPYLFNTPENQSYIGKIPHIKYFSPNDMKADKRKEFIEWYKMNQDVEYDFQRELKEYCISDVKILKQALEIYINDNVKENKINPLSCPTIASFDMKVYRTQHYDGNIAVLNKEEYDLFKKGFFGGRTEVFRHKIQFTEHQIKRGYFAVYKDICSLYPTVQFYDELPCGIPIFVNNPEYDDVERFLIENFGYCEVDIICPKDKNVIPLLPERKDGKLIFDMMNKYNVIYTSAELLKAVQIGYKITKVHKSFKFEKSTELFKSYIRKFLKIKAEAGGYKGENIDEYITKYLSLGIQLDKDNIKSNKGLKLLAKNMLNNLWGKFGQKDNLPTTEYVNTDQWFRLLQRHKDGKIELKNETLIDAECAYVQYIENESDNTSLINTNVALAGFITSQARLRLYKEMEKIGKDRLIYCDTDSLVYINSPTEYNIPDGEMLGEWENETSTKENPCNPITYFVALAPKSYGYKTQFGQGDIKCKGITLNCENSKKYTLESLDDLITGKINHIDTKKMMFNKDSKKGEIRTEIVKKVIKFDRTKTKSNIQDDYTTQPFRQTDSIEKMLEKRKLILQ